MYTYGVTYYLIQLKGSLVDTAVSCRQCSRWSGSKILRSFAEWAVVWKPRGMM